MNLHYFYLSLKELTDRLNTTHPEVAEELDVLSGLLSAEIHPLHSGGKELSLEEYFKRG